MGVPLRLSRPSRGLLCAGEAAGVPAANDGGYTASSRPHFAFEKDNSFHTEGHTGPHFFFFVPFFLFF